MIFFGKGGLLAFRSANEVSLDEPEFENDKPRKTSRIRQICSLRQKGAVYALARHLYHGRGSG